MRRTLVALIAVVVAAAGIAAGLAMPLVSEANMVAVSQPVPVPAPIGLSTFDTTRNTAAVIAFSNNNATATANSVVSGNATVAYTTRFHFAGLWVFRFIVNTCPPAPGCEVGMADGSEGNGIQELGHLGGHSFGVDNSGNVIIKAVVVGTTGISFTSGDTVDLVVDLTNKTVQETKNGGSLSAAISIATMTAFTLSPAAAAYAASEQFTFVGYLPITYPGATQWDGIPAPPPPQSIRSISLSNTTFTCNSANAAVGAVVVTMSPASPLFSGNLSVVGTNSGGFHVVGNTLEANSSGTTGCQTYNDFEIQATQPGVSNSPFTSSAQSVTGSGSTGTACVLGPNDNRPLQAAAANVGFTTCLANFDWSSNSNFAYNGNTYNFQQLNTWLDCAGAGTNSLWWVDLNGQTNVPCSNFSIVSDGGTNVLSVVWHSTDPLQQTAITTNDPTERIGTTYPTNRFSETRARIVDVSGSIYSDIWSYGDGGLSPPPNGSNETDLIEIGTNGGGFGGNNSTIPCNGASGTCFFLSFSTPGGFDATQWHTYGDLEFFNTDNTRGANHYTDGVWDKGGGPVTMNSPGGSAYTSGRVYLVISSCYAVGDCKASGVSQHTTLVQYYRVYSCSSGYAGNSSSGSDPAHACYHATVLGPP